MKYLFIILSIFLFYSGIPFYGFTTSDIEYYPCYNNGPEESPIFNLPLLSREKLEIIYKYSNKYKINPMFIASINYAETVMGKYKIHRNPIDKGEFGLHESKIIRSERVDKWGYYDPNIYDDCCKISTLVLLENLEFFDYDIEKGFSSYNTGIQGTIDNGINYNYLKSIYKYFNMCQKSL